MPNFQRALKGAVTMGLITIALSVGGCTKYASQDDLNKLEDAKRAALSAENELRDVQSEKRSVEGQLADKRQELEKAQRELDDVKSR